MSVPSNLNGLTGKNYITPCSPLSINRRLGGTYRIHCASETSVDPQWTAQHLIPENGSLQNYRWENLKSYKNNFHFQFNVMKVNLI
jgi:hypothetical protein